MAEQNQTHFKILVADDESSILSLFEKTLSTKKVDCLMPPETGESKKDDDHNDSKNRLLLPFKVVTCRQGSEAVDAVKKSLENKQPFAVAFLDVRMPPGPDGVWTAEQIRILDSRIEIVIMTGHSDFHPHEIVCRVPPAHQLLYIKKPLHISEIAQFATALASKWHMENELHKVYTELERRVEERTQDLERLNKELQTEIAERKQAEAELKKSERKYKTLTDSSLTGIFIQQDGKYVFVNDRFAEIHGYTPPELLGKEYIAFIHPDERMKVAEIVSKRLKGEPTFNQYEVRRITKSGETILCEMVATLVEYGGRPAIMGNIINITERKQAEAQIRILTRQLMQAQERERQMISYELHDTIAQNLSTLKLSFDMMVNSPLDVSCELSEKTGKLSELILQTIKAVRNLAYDLRPPGIDQWGIVDALKIYCEEFSEESGIKVEFQSAGINEMDLDLDGRMHVYRLVQEGLNNIRKHAEADIATVKLAGSSSNIILHIEDNGKGFDVQARERALDNEKRMGLRSMKERVNLLQGLMRIQSQSNIGTQIFIKFPYLEQPGRS